MAGLRSSSYTGEQSRRQPCPAQSRVAWRVGALGRGVAVVMAAAMLGGCAGIMMPLSAWTAKSEPAEPDITGSIPKPATSAPQAATDAGVVLKAIEAAGVIGRDAPIAWANEATGNTGTITHIVAGRALNGAPCRDFETTLVTIEGVRLHAGRACQGYDGPWEMVHFDRLGG